MNDFELLLLNSILVLFPISLYLIFLYTNKNIRYQKVCFLISILSSILLVYRFGSISDMNIIGIMFLCVFIFIMYFLGTKILKDKLTYNELINNNQIQLSLFKITHEIKNPIAVIKGYLDMLNMNDSKQVQRYIPIIRSEIERLLILLQDFLLINKININTDIMDINMLVEEQVKKLSKLIEEKHIRLNTDIIDDEIYIKGDYNRLSQVVINVIKNSIEAIDENGIINVKTRISNNKFNIIVEDNGEGMDEKTLKKIKEPFFTTKSRGTGLGVCLSYEIIGAHNGKINYVSSPGKGTTVYIEIPILA